MGKILTVDEAIRESKKLHTDNKRLVLTGGCFDILHIGHVTLLSEAKKRGDSLFVLLESDESIQKSKGDSRPINTQKDRALLLSHLSDVDIVIPLPYFEKDDDYDRLIFQLKPAIIATTTGDPAKRHKLRQAAQVKADAVDVTEYIQNASTTRLAQIVQKEL